MPQAAFRSRCDRSCPRRKIDWRITKEEFMSEFKRREFLKATAGVAAGTAIGAGMFAPDASAQTWNVKPEKGAKLRVLRWKRFVQGDEDVWASNTKKFTETTGIEVRVD